jgi:hypothetical protein
LPRVIVGDGTAPLRSGELVVRIATGARARTGGGEANVLVSIANERLSRRVARAVAAAVRASSPPRGPAPRVVRFRSRKRLAELESRAGGDASITGSIVVIQLTQKNARYLEELVSRARACGPAGIQIVWDAVTPPRARVEKYVFGVLERARGAPEKAPVVLAADRTPCESLLLLAARSNRKDAVR